MPPVDRLKPIRADSSESGYTLIDFMREWPNDATCLEWLRALLSVSRGLRGDATRAVPSSGQPSYCRSACPAYRRGTPRGAASGACACDS
jgi:hypothetical protein